MDAVGDHDCELLFVVDKVDVTVDEPLQDTLDVLDNVMDRDCDAVTVGESEVVTDAV